MPSRLKSLGPPLDEASVVALERRLGTSLPSDYRRFLIESNGGVPLRRGFRSQASGQEWSINVIFGLTRPLASSNVQSNIEATSETRPAGQLPIAATDTGEFVLLSIGGRRPGAVSLWQWQEDDMASRARHLHPLAPSFAEFLESLGDV
jgi:hypothetical protein